MHSPLDIEERAAEARALQNNSVLKEAFANVREEQLRILIQEPVGSLTAGAAHATVKALDGVLQQLQSIVNEALMQRKK